MIFGIGIWGGLIAEFLGLLFIHFFFFCENNCYLYNIFADGNEIQHES